MSAVDVLAVLDLLSEHAGTLRPYAQDTGGFRVGNKGATELAAACAAAIRVAEARATVAELIDTTQQIRDAVVLRKARDVDPQWIDDQMQRLGKVLARAGGRSEEHTSELQSLMRISYAVFCLKKKLNQQNKR